MTVLGIEPLNAPFGARVTGVDLTGELSEVDMAAIREAIDTHSLLCFPDQPMTDDAHLAFTRRLGEPEAEHVTLGRTGRVVYFGTVGNVADDGYRSGPNAHPYPLPDRKSPLALGFFLPARAFLRFDHPRLRGARRGSGTSFASMRHAWAGLPSDTQAMIEPLQAIHDYVFSRTQVVPVDLNHAASLPPVVHRLVRTNPGNGLKNYYVGSHARSIVGWTGIESRRLLDDLLERATAPADIYTHQWRAGDTVIWDNRCLLHRGTGYDADRWRRRMRQTRVVGTGPTLEEQ